MNPARLKAYLLLLIVSVIWGVAGPIIKFTLGGISPLLFLTYRFFLSSLVAIIFISFTGFHLPKDKNLLVKLIIFSILTSTISLGLLFLGIEKTTVLDLSLINLITPLLVSVAGVYFLREHITFREKIGMGIALVGTALIVFEPFLGVNHQSLKFSGNVLIFLSLLAGAYASVLAKELLRNDISPATLAHASFIVGLATILPISLFIYTPSQIIQSVSTLPFPYHLGVVFMAILSGNLAYTLWSKAQKTIEISEAAIFSYLYPIFAAPLAILWLKEKITIPYIIGGIIIAIGVVIAEYKKPKKEIAS
ncbi:MAG: DMT family transporter [Patescibacteria group bacterium]